MKCYFLCRGVFESSGVEKYVSSFFEVEPEKSNQSNQYFWLTLAHCIMSLLHTLLDFAVDT